MKQRIDYLDIAKGIGIILVVVGHYVYSANNETQNLLVYWIYSFHMPLFFFISGLLFTAKDNFIHFLLRKIRSLIVPYVLFSIICFAFNFIEHKSIGIKNALLGWGGHPMWFITCLFEMEIVHYLIFHTRKWKYPVVFVLIIFFLYKITYNGWLPYSVSELPHFYTYFLLAYFLRNRFKPVENRKFVIPVCIVLWLIHWFTLKWTLNYNPQYRVSDNDLLSFVLRYVTSVLGLVATLLLSSWLGKHSIKKPFIWMGCNTLVILCLHMVFYNFMLRLNLPYFSAEPFIYIEIGILLYVSIILYNKYNPKLLKVLHL